MKFQRRNEVDAVQWLGDRDEIQEFLNELGLMRVSLQTGFFDDLHVMNNHALSVLKQHNWLVYEEGALRSVPNHEFRKRYQAVEGEK